MAKTTDKEHFFKNWLQFNGTDLSERKLERWACLFTLTGSELKMAYQLKKKNMPFFIPIYKTRKNNFLSLFPGYIFTRVASDNIEFAESISYRMFLSSYPSGEKKLLNELSKFSSYYEESYKYHKGDKVKISLVPDLNLENVLGEILEVNDHSNDVEISIPFFQRPHKLTISKDVLTPVKERPHILIASDKKILSEKYITVEEQHVYKKPIETILKDVNQELINFLKSNPNYIYKLTSRKYEELVMELLIDMGYECELTPETRDGGRDIIAIFHLPPNRKMITLVECKRYSADNKISIDIIERFLFVIQRKFDTNGGLIATTSYFTEGARKLEQQYQYSLSLHDFDSMKSWLNNYGDFEKSDSGTLWIPKKYYSESKIVSSSK